MGRQIRFFISNDELIQLCEIAISKGGFLVNSRNESLSLIATPQFFIVVENSKLFYWENGKTIPYRVGQVIDRISSDVLVLSSCRKVEYPNTDPNGYEHGRVWYETSFFDDDGNLIKKNKELDSIFNELNRYIRKNYIISTDKQWYMGPNTYEKYLEGKYIPYSGINPIEF